MPDAPHSNTTGNATSAISGHFDTRTAAMEVAESLHAGLSGGDSGGGCDLVIMFASFHHAAAFSEASEVIRSTLNPKVMMGVTAESVLGGDDELEGAAGLSALALRLPGTKLHPFTFSPNDPLPLSNPTQIPECIGLTDDHRVTLLLADPFTTPVTRFLPAFNACGHDRPIPIVGGMASGGSQPGYNRILCNEQVMNAGGVGVNISGDIGVDFIVSQGCRPIGNPMVITKSENHVILELGGRPAMEMVKKTAESLPDHEKKMLTHGLLLGTVINEYKDHQGRGDFLIRNVLGFDEKRGGLLAGEQSNVGQTIQLQVRDAKTASEDLQLLLDAQQLHQPPFGALLFTCNGRGQRLFGKPNHDLEMIHNRLGDVPTAGFFCAGEIGPIGDQSFLHGHTASLVVFREPS
ncbi:MAG: FIST C-terminal domain-containing protein [Planctomycetota bacterium]|nr:FIST C-terminal domain-containing protein [Planctomycetota bacterium]